MALCEILGISLNEFIAGEDIEPAEVVQKSEENLIQVTEDGEHRKRKLKKIIVLLAVFGSVMAGILIYLLTFKNQPRVNYIEPLAQDSTEMNVAGMLSDADGAFLYDYAVDKEIKGISFKLAVYKKGVLESESSLGTISWSELEQISLRNGMIAVIPDFQNFKVKLIAAGEGTNFLWNLIFWRMYRVEIITDGQQKALMKGKQRFSPEKKSAYWLCIMQKTR